MMKTSPSGRAAIEQRECRRLTAYQDSTGVWTIGVGHTGRTAPPAAHAGMTITQAQCDAYLAADLAPTERSVNNVGVLLNQNQFDALVSFVFNIGTTAFSKSSCLQALLRRDYDGAAKAMLLFELPAVLKGRRKAEVKQFDTPEWPSSLSATTPAAAKPTPAPAAAAKAPTAAAKEHAMTATASTVKATAPASKESLGQLVADFLKGAVVKLGTAVSTLEGGASVVASAPALATEAVGSISSAKDAISHITAIVTEIESGKWLAAGGDLEGLLSDVLAIFAKFGINYAPLTALSSVVAAAVKAL